MFTQGKIYESGLMKPYSFFPTITLNKENKRNHHPISKRQKQLAMVLDLSWYPNFLICNLQEKYRSKCHTERHDTTRHDVTRTISIVRNSTMMRIFDLVHQIKLIVRLDFFGVVISLSRVEMKIREKKF